VARAYPRWLDDAEAAAARALKGSDLFFGQLWGQGPLEVEQARLRWHLGVMRLRLGGCRRGLADLREAARLDPALPRALLSLAVAEGLCGDRAAARRRFDQAASLDSNSWIEAANLAAALRLEIAPWKP